MQSCGPLDGFSTLRYACRRRRSGTVDPSPRAAPLERSVWTAPNAPTQLVNELVVERADKREVVEVGAATGPPPHDVMGLHEGTGRAPRERAPPVPVPHLAEQPGGRVTRDPSHSDCLSVGSFHNRLETAGAQQALRGEGRDHRTTLHLAPPPFRRQRRGRPGKRDRPLPAWVGSAPPGGQAPSRPPPRLPRAGPPPAGTDDPRRGTTT